MSHNTAKAISNPHQVYLLGVEYEHELLRWV